MVRDADRATHTGCEKKGGEETKNDPVRSQRGVTDDTPAKGRETGRA